MTNATPTNTSLDKLPNLGTTTVMWLRAIGIRDSNTLRDRGIFWAYERMQARGFRVTTAVLFSLEGALQERPWRSFSAAEKASLLKQQTHMANHADIAAKPLPQRAAPRRAARKPTQKDKKQQSKQEG